jgi:biotin operon repressor
VKRIAPLEFATFNWKGHVMRRILSFTSLTLSLGPALQAKAAQTDWFIVDTILTRPAAISGDVHRYGLLRSDLKVSVDGIALKPAFALGGWLAFEPMGDSAMMMGDLVLTESEINPVMTKLQAEGVEVTALHNHLLRSNPPIFYMHVAGQGDPAQLARKVRAALEESRTPFDVKPPAEAAANSGFNFDTPKVEAAIGFKGRANGGVYQFGISRADSMKMQDMNVPPAMGTAIAINFQPTGEGKAAITGDFVLVASEVNPVLQALRENGIEVTAIHNHMLNDEPRLFFMHFWANDDAVKLARGLKAALDKVNLAKS